MLTLSFRSYTRRRSIIDSFGHVEEVPFPSLAGVRRKGLTPDRAVFVPRVPAVDDQDRFSIQGVFAKEMAHAVFVEGTNDWRIDRPRVARDPVKTPESRLVVEQPQGKAFEKSPLRSGKLRGGIGIHVGRAVQNLHIHI